MNQFIIYGCKTGIHFFLNHRLSSVFPCDFALKYEDDQWPIDNTIQQRLINNAKGKNVIIGFGGYLVGNSYCGYSPKNFKKIEKDIVWWRRYKSFFKFMEIM